MDHDHEGEQGERCARHHEEQGERNRAAAGTSGGEMPWGFYAEIVGELVEEDGLAVLAEGLGQERVVEELAKLQAPPQGGNASGRQAQGLVLVLGLGEEEKGRVKAGLERAGVRAAELGAGTGASERKGVYEGGGAVFVSTRIATVDMLSGHLVRGRVAGMVVANAHRCSEGSQEAFAARLLREGGADAFVRGVTERPLRLPAGVNGPERVMEGLGVKRIYLWPRFEARVKGSLEGGRVEVQEWLPEPSEEEARVQEALKQCVSLCLRELSKSRWVDVAGMGPEDALFRGADAALAGQLGPSWHAAPKRVKQAVRDLRTLRRLAEACLRHDAHSFLSALEGARQAEGRDSLWLLSSPAQRLFESAKRRASAGDETARAPKWAALEEALSECLAELEAASQRDLATVVVVRDGATKEQVEHALCDWSREDGAAKRRRLGSAEGAVVVRDGRVGEGAGWVVMYEPCLRAVREAEVRAAEAGRAIKVHFIAHDGWAERGRYVAAVRREQERFAQLISRKAKMAPSRALHQARPSPAPRPRARGSLTHSVGRAVVDAREFMSALPGELHRAGWELRPATLRHGDYALSCGCRVERKAVPDLLSSLGSGRLLAQAKSLCSRFSMPVLLVESDGTRPLSLVPPGEVPAAAGPASPIARLSLLLLHHPRLRVLWSPSLPATARLFRTLQRETAGEDPPFPADDEGEDEQAQSDAGDASPNPAGLDFLARLPGVTQRNLGGLLTRLSSLAELPFLSQADLALCLGDSRQASVLYTFLHTRFPSPQALA